MKLSRSNPVVEEKDIKRNRLLCVESHTNKVYINLSALTKCEIVGNHLRYLGTNFVLDIDLSNAPDMAIKEKLIAHFEKAVNTNVEEHHTIHFKDRISDDYLSTRVITAFSYGVTNVKVQTQNEVLFYEISQQELLQLLQENFTIIETVKVGLFRLMKTQR